jgi:hypothetical protein
MDAADEISDEQRPVASTEVPLTFGYIFVISRSSVQAPIADSNIPDTSSI